MMFNPLIRGAGRVSHPLIQRSTVSAIKHLPFLSQDVGRRAYRTFTDVNHLYQRRYDNVKTKFSKEINYEMKTTQLRLGKVYDQSLATSLFKKEQTKLFLDPDEYAVQFNDAQDIQQEKLDRFTDGKAHTSQEKRQLNSHLISTLDSEHLQKYVRTTFSPVEKKGHKGKAGVLLRQNDRSLDQVYEDSRKFIRRSQDFSQSLEGALQECRTPEEKALALEHFLYDGVKEQEGKILKGIKRFNEQELKVIYMKLWDVDAHDLMVEMMENCKNKAFTTNPINLEFYARATLKGNYFNLSKAQAVADLLLEQSPDQPEGLAIQGTIHAIAKNAAKNLLIELDQGKMEPDTIDLYRKCFPEDSINRENILHNYYESLSASIVYYEEAFSQSFDCRYGCRVMHRLVEQGSTDRAHQMAEMTILAAEKEGGLKSNNLAVVRSYLEALYVIGDSERISFAEDVLLSLCTRESQIKSTLGSLQDLMLDSAPRKRFETVLRDQLKRFEHHPQQAQQFVAEKKAKVKSSLHAWEKVTFSYKGVNSNSIDGNFRFGARLPAQHINRCDQQFIKEILSTPLPTLLPDEKDVPQMTLLEVSDPAEFDRYVNAFIRDTFRTDALQLERLDSRGHASFDKTVKGVLAVSGAPTPEVRKLIPDSRTNISNNIVLGLGDCRHHAQVKQMLFDMWHNLQLNSVLANIKIAYERNDGETIDYLQQEFSRVNNQQVRTFDCEVHLPVEVENGYPVWEKGHLVKRKDNQVVKVEEHTMNIELKTDPKTDELQATLCDSFYQHTYPWENCSLDTQEDLSQGVTAGFIEVYNRETDKIEECPVVIRPTEYAGSREVYDRGSNESYLIGQPVQPLSFEEALTNRPAIERELSQVRQWYDHFEARSMFKSVLS